MGTHIDYSMRYPKEFKKFSPEDEQGLNTINLSQKIRAEYDNAVLYNDFVVNEIIKRFETRNAIIIYIFRSRAGSLRHYKFYGTQWSS